MDRDLFNGMNAVSSASSTVLLLLVKMLFDNGVINATQQTELLDSYKKLLKAESVDVRNELMLEILNKLLD